MNHNNHTTALRLSKSKLTDNLEYFQSKLDKDCKTLLVLKAFGYGSSATLIGKFLESQVAYFGVAYLDEGIALREAGIEKPILVLHPQIENLEQLYAHNLEPNIYNFEILQAVLKLPERTQKRKIHLKINTGLQRLGFDLDELERLQEVLNNQKDQLDLVSVFSHLAASEDPLERTFSLDQIKDFNVACDYLKNHLPYDFIKHMSNTSGILNYPQAHFDMVRMGIGLYGFANEPQHTQDLKKAWRLTSPISQIRRVKKGTTVGYNRASRLEKDTLIGIIPIGHADGISRQLGQRQGWVSLNGEKAEIIGNVCMDMILVDLSKIKTVPKVGDQVEIYESQETLNLFATKCHTINYELLTAIGPRIKRELID